MRTSLVQKEIDRLVKYSEGLGIIVRFKSSNDPHVAATWSNYPPEIEIFTNNNTSKTDIILSLLHELGHHHDWLNNGRKEIPEAYTDEANRKKGDPPLSREKRRIIYDNERRGINYMAYIADQVNLKTPPLWRIMAEMAYDKWSYRYYFVHGDDPSRQEKIKKRKKLIKKYKELAKNAT